MFNTNGRNSGVNNMYYIPGSAGTAVWKTQSFGTWPSSLTGTTTDSTIFSIYVSY